MCRHESGIQRGKPDTLAASELSQPGIGDLFVALNALVRDMLIAEASINETVHRVRLNELQISPSCRRCRVCGEHHVQAEEGALGH